MPKIITLTTDFGDKDYYVGAMKGVIVSIAPTVSIIDICHQIKAGDIREAAFIIGTAFKYFPKGTIHLLVIDPGVGSNRRIVIVKSNDYCFIAPDNGVLSYVVYQLKNTKIVSVTNKEYFLENISNTFQGRDIFAPVAAYLAKGIKTEEFGEEIDDLLTFSLKEVYEDGQSLIGEIIYIDRFGNLVTNFTPNNLSSLKNINIRVGDYEIFQISNSYAQNNPGDLLAIWGSYGYLEISVNQGSAEELLKTKKGDIVTIKETK